MKIKIKYFSLFVFLVFSLFFIYMFIYPIAKWNSVVNNISKNELTEGSLILNNVETQKTQFIISSDSARELFEIVNRANKYYPAHESFDNFGMVEIEGLIFELKSKEDKILISIHEKSKPYIYLKRVQISKIRLAEWLKPYSSK